MTGYKKRTVIMVIGLIALIGLVGCGKNGGYGSLSDEERIEKGLDAFAHLKNGKIQMKSHLKYDLKEAAGAESKVDLNITFNGDFEKSPDHLLGVYDNGKDKYDYYHDAISEYSKPVGAADWTNNTESTKKRHYNQPNGISREAIEFLKTKKKDIKVTDDKETFTIVYETDDIKLLGANGDFLVGGSYNGPIYVDSDTSDKLKMELTVSKKDFKPLSVKYTCEQNNPKLTVRFKSTVKYSKQNSGVRVEVPSGIGSAASK